MVNDSSKVPRCAFSNCSRDRNWERYWAEERNQVQVTVALMGSCVIVAVGTGIDSSDAHSPLSFAFVSISYLRVLRLMIGVWQL